MTAPRLEVRDLTKSYGKVRALKSVSLSFAAGRVHGIAGHNGAGKSTLVRLIGGLEAPNGGTLLIDGEEQRFKSVAESISMGVTVVQQTPQACETLTVAENLFLGRQPRAAGRVINWREMARKAEAELTRIGVDIDPKAVVSNLSLAERQLIEIARATSRSSRVLILDEPTTALSAREVDRLFGVVRELRAHDVAVMLVDHKLDEVMSICDEVSVLRDGALVASSPISETSTNLLADQIVGHPHREDELARRSPAVAAAGPAKFQVTDLTRTRYYEDISFEIRAGEVVGLAGLVGSGRSRIAKALAGIEPATSGSIAVDGQVASIRSVANAHDAGIAYLPEDRASYGLFLDMSIEANITMGSLGETSRGPFLDHAAEHALAEQYVERLGVICSDVHQAVGELSGGNQQKVLLARWLAFQPSLLILDEPTQGIDIGVKEEIYRLVRGLARDDLAILFISSEFEELVDVCDRILVVQHGRIIAQRLATEIEGASDLVRLVSEGRPQVTENSA